MIKNPTTLSNVNLFLAEVKQDVIVINKFPIPERGEISRDENDKRMKRDFPPLLDILVEKGQEAMVMFNFKHDENTTLFFTF